MRHRSPSYQDPHRPTPIRFSPLSPWRLLFADRYRRPVSWAEKRQLRFRATFFILVGVALTLAVQSWAGKSGFLCPP
jgi:hypothetical protein